MKKYLDIVLVVEGKSDAALISSLYDCEIVTTNGFDIKKDLVDYLNTVSLFKRVVLLTDSDPAGQVIRARLSALINKHEDVVVDASRCSKNNKHGVAECDINHLTCMLDKFLSDNEQTKYIKESELYNLLHEYGVDKYEIFEKCHTGKCNRKTLLMRLNSLRLTKEKILEVTSSGN